LWCTDNQLMALDVSQNPNLGSLRCQNNQLTNLDVSQNLDLTHLYCDSNQLVGNLLLNGLSELRYFNATNNPDLLCIQVDNAADANAGVWPYVFWNWQKDVTATYSESCGVLSSEIFYLDSSVTAYPNPTTDNIHFTLPSELEKVEIHDLQGRKMLESKSETINIEKLPEGMYFVKIQLSNKQKVTKKIIVSRQ